MYAARFHDRLPFVQIVNGFRERINAQAKDLVIERPYLRNQQSIINQNTLIYALINLRALQRITDG